MATYEITVTPVTPSPSTTGGWRWTVVDAAGQAYSSPSISGTKADAKTAAEAYATQLEGVESYSFTPGG
jgi:hypothetical protein